MAYLLCCKARLIDDVDTKNEQVVNLLDADADVTEEFEEESQDEMEDETTLPNQDHQSLKMKMEESEKGLMERISTVEAIVAMELDRIHGKSGQTKTLISGDDFPQEEKYERSPLWKGRAGGEAGVDSGVIVDGPALSAAGEPEGDQISIAPREEITEIEVTKEEPPDSSAASVAETVSERPNSSPPIPTIAPKLESSLPTLISPPKEQFEGTIRQDVTGSEPKEIMQEGDDISPDAVLTKDENLTTDAEVIQERSVTEDEKPHNGEVIPYVEVVENEVIQDEALPDQEEIIVPVNAENYKISQEMEMDGNRFGDSPQRHGEMGDAVVQESGERHGGTRSDLKREFSTSLHLLETAESSTTLISESPEESTKRESASESEVQVRIANPDLDIRCSGSVENSDLDIQCSETVENSDLDIQCSETVEDLDIRCSESVDGFEDEFGETAKQLAHYLKNRTENSAITSDDEESVGVGGGGGGGGESDIENRPEQKSVDLSSLEEECEAPRIPDEKMAEATLIPKQGFQDFVDGILDNVEMKMATEDATQRLSVLNVGQESSV